VAESGKFIEFVLVDVRVLWVLLYKFELFMAGRGDSGALVNSASASETDEDGDDESQQEDASDSGDEGRVEERTATLLEFDANFSKKRWRKLTPSWRKTVSSILMLGKDKEKTPKSNNSLTRDRQHWLSACRGMYAQFYSLRRSMDSQNDAHIAMLNSYKLSQYFVLCKVVPKVFSTNAVTKYVAAYAKVRIRTFDECIYIYYGICNEMSLYI
jgi:hypothetical protein